MGYTRDTVKGIGWVGLLRLSTRGVSLLRTIILARLLTPVQFGVFGIAILFTALLEVFTETGVNVVLIQEKDDMEKYIDSAWIVSIIRGIVIASVIFISAKFVSFFFNSPQSFFLIQLISLAPLFRGFINPSSVKFQKYLEFHKEFWYRSLIFFFDASVTIISAFITRSAMSLVLGFIAGVLLEVFLSFYIIKPIPHFNLDKTYFLKVFHQGKWVTLGGIFNYLYHNADNIVVGKILGSGALGLYEIAYRISMLPITEIADVVQKVTFPVYSKISGDILRLRSAFLKTMLFITILSVPLGLILFLFPETIVRIILGEKWLPMVPVLKILAVFGVLRAISGSSSALFLAVGKQKFVSVVTLISLLGLMIPIIPLTIKFGIIGAGISALIGTLIAVPVFAYFSFKILYEAKTTKF